MNLATERASVSYPPGIGVDDLVGAVVGAGYGAHVAGVDEPDPPSPLRAAADRCRRPDRAARRDLDDPGLPFPRVGVGRARAGHSRGLLVRRRIPPRGAELAPPSRGDDGHARLAWDARRLVVVGGRGVPRLGGHVFRGRRRRDHADPAGSVPRDAGQAPFRRRVALARQAGRQGGTRPARRRRGGDSRRGARHRRPVRRASRREARRGRSRRRGFLRARPVDADRRAGSRGGRAGREGGRRDDQYVGTARRDRNPYRRRDGGRADRTARHRSPDGEGAGAAARRSDLRRVRPGRRCALARHARGLARLYRRRERRVHGSGRRPDHRVPLRSRTRDADRAARRHGPRRAARGHHPRPGGPRAHPPRHDRRPGQDRHRDRRAHEARRRRAVERGLPRGRAAPGGRGGGRKRASDRARDRRRGPRGARIAACGRGVRLQRGDRRDGAGRGSRDHGGTAVVVARRNGRRRLVGRRRARAARPLGPGETDQRRGRGRAARRSVSSRCS